MVASPQDIGPVDHSLSLASPSCKEIAHGIILDIFKVEVGILQGVGEEAYH